MSLGKKIKAAREAKGWRQRDLAQAMNTAESYICNLENDGVPNPKADTITRLAAVLGVTPNDLLLDPEPAEAGNGD